MSDLNQLQYPVGRFQPLPTYSPAEIQRCIDDIEQLPDRLADLLAQFSLAQLDQTYRPGGWTARQVVHHIADSHVNSYVRTKWALTEDKPTIKAYDEKLWATTPDAKLDPWVSQRFLVALHQKWTGLLRAMSSDDFSRRFIHPETKKEIPLDRNVALYAWHGKHHCGHLQLILD